MRNMPGGKEILLDNPVVKVWRWRGKRYAQLKRLRAGHPMKEHRDVALALKQGYVEATLVVMAKYQCQYPAASEKLYSMVYA